MSSNNTSYDDVKAYISTITDRVLNYRNISVMVWNSPLDNHNPTREYGSGYAVQYTHDNVDWGYALFHDGQFGTGRKLAFLIDDGKSVRPFYLAAHNESGGYFILHPFPIGQDFGPRKMYHLSVKPFETVHSEYVSSESVHPDDCGFCKSGESQKHNYEPEREVIELHDFPYVGYKSRVLDA